MKIFRQTEKEKKKRSESMEIRLFGLLGLMAAAMLLLAVRLIWIAMEHNTEYEKIILSQQNYSSSVVPFRRGTITDRNGTVLALSDRVYTLILDPRVILSGNGKNEEATLQALYQVYGYDTEELAALIAENSDRSYLRYKNQLTETEKSAFEDYAAQHNAKSSERVTGVWFEEDYMRVYPFHQLGCTLLGFSAGDSARGNWGIEESYNSQLTGVNGRSYGYINTDGEAERNLVSPVNGNTVVSTVDYTIQAASERAIDAFLEKYSADNAAVICMNPNNGEILALATDKRFDLNDPAALDQYISPEKAASMNELELAEARAKIWRNFAVEDAYEPGSTAKPFTVAAALEEQLVSADDEYECTGKKTFGKKGSEVTIRCNKKHGTVNLKESLVYSCNSAMMDIAATIGKDIFTDYQSLFGFGKQSGVDLPGETAGLIYSAENMGVTDLATNAFGQNFNVNMVQLAAAFCSLINGGSYYQPFAVKQICNESGTVIQKNEPVLVRETVSAETCEFIKDALFHVVEDGTGSGGQLKGYLVGGKTGTAQKHPRSEKKYLVSFVGFAPADNPQVLIYAVVDNPLLDEDEKISADLAVEIEKQVMNEIIPYLNIESAGETEPFTMPGISEEPLTDEDGNVITSTDNRREEVPNKGYLEDEEHLTEEEAEEED